MKTHNLFSLFFLNRCLGDPSRAFFVGGDSDVGEGSTTSKDEDESEEAVMLGGSSTRSQEEIGGGGCRLRGGTWSTRSLGTATIDDTRIGGGWRSR